MKILIIGGKKFLGYHCVKSAISNGHEVTLFNRGLTNPELFPEIETILGDRNSEKDLEKLNGRVFDAVIDTSCYFPGQMQKTVDVVGKNAGVYAFVSTMGILDFTGETAVDEQTKKLRAEYEATEIGYLYGELKCACEEVLSKALPDKAIMIRPGLICGDRDGTDRFTYYPVKIKYQQKLILPDEDFKFQLIDVRDLADFIVHTIETRQLGAFNVTGPNRTLMFSEFLALCKEVLNPDCQIVRIKPADLEKHELVLQEDFPFPGWYTNPAIAAIYNSNVEKCVRAGLHYRPLLETIFDAVHWYDESTGRAGDSAKLRSGLSCKKENEILKKIGM